ncbi:hypothetical protein CHUAL_004520 [Chamberlinius hualienensis]
MMAVNSTKQRLSDPYEDIEAYLARAEKEIGDAFDNIVMVAANEVQGGGTQDKGRNCNGCAVSSSAVGSIDKNAANHKTKVSQPLNQIFPPPPPPRFQSLMLDARIRRYREDLIQNKTSSKRSASRSYRNMSCPARQRFLDDLTNSLTRINRSYSDSEDSERQWRQTRRSSLPSSPKECPVELCSEMDFIENLKRPKSTFDQRNILNDKFYDGLANQSDYHQSRFGNDKNHLLFLQDVEQTSSVGKQRKSCHVNSKSPHKLSNRMDFDSISSFIDSVVQELNSLSIDDELGETEKENLAKLASCFPEPKIRKEKLWVRPVNVKNIMAESDPDYESIDEDDDVFGVFSEDSRLTSPSQINDDKDASTPSSISPLDNYKEEKKETLRPLPKDDDKNVVYKVKTKLVDKDFGDEHIISIKDICEFAKDNQQNELNSGTKVNTRQKPCVLSEFLKQVESSIREVSGAESPSFLSAESCEDSIDCILKSGLTDAATQTTPPLLSRSTSFTWYCDCHCNNQECKHRQSVIWEEVGHDLLNASVNDVLSAVGGTAESVEELMKLDSVCDQLEEVKDLSINECEVDSSSSSYSLSASLDNISSGHSSSDEEGESLSLASTFDSATSHGQDSNGRLLKLNLSDKAIGSSSCKSNELTVLNSKLSDNLTDEDKSAVCLTNSVDVGTSPFNTLCNDTANKMAILNKAKQSGCCKMVRNDCSKRPELITDGRFSCSLDQMTGKCHNFETNGECKFSTVPIPKPRTISSICPKSDFSDNIAYIETSGLSNGSDNNSKSINENSLNTWIVDNCEWLNCNKSFSAPILGCTTRPTSVSDRGSLSAVERTSLMETKESKELEAVEACKWLRAAGFPQYAQMFEDMQFPIDISAVQKDHYFLDHDSLQSLFRRLNALNRCARMRLDNLPRKLNGDDSDEENQCALSENWKFQRQSRRWSRIPGNFEAVLTRRDSNKDEWYVDNPESGIVDASNNIEMESSGNKFHLPVLEVAETGDPIPMEEDGGSSSASPPASEKCDTNSSPLKRSGSERLKDGAKALLRRVESLKSRRSRRKNREVVVISGPQLLDVPGKDDGETFTCLQVTPPDTPALRLYSSPSVGESTSPSSNSPLDTSPSSSTNKIGRKKGRKFFGGRYRGEDSCALSDSECSPTIWRSGPSSPTGVTKCYIENFLAPDSPHHLVNEGCDNIGNTGINYRTGSFNLGVESSYRERFKESHSRGNKRDSSDLEPDRQSVYDNVPVVIFNRGYTDDTLKPVYQSLPSSSALSVEQKGDDSSTNEFASSNEVDSGSAASTVHDTSDREGRSPTNLERRDSGVGLSLTRSDRSQSIWHTSVKCHRPSIPCRSVPLNELSSGQIMVIRKLALLKLTALMERYSPSNRSGWNWAMPKFIKRMKTPEYKDKMVFGVPLVVVLQRTGQPIPPSIQSSIRYIRKCAMDSVGIFRKSGVRSRIQKLKNLHEANPSNVVYDEQQPYDVADLLKQYFRELPEALLTNKMSETFISIYQHVAEEARLEALQAALVLLPDENREVLQALLSFLNDVANRSKENQMTASNLAVCFAPSLFHMSCPRSQSTSPRRRKTVGVPDQRELSENRAAHECLTQMICDFNYLFSIPDDILGQVRCPYMDHWQPPTMEQVLLAGSNDYWKTSVEHNTQWLLKESKDKFKSWVQISTNDGTDLSYKKVGDGNPLRIWKVAVEIEAPPTELLNSLLRERHLWDSDILKWRVIERLNKQTEVFQYVCNSMTPLPARDYCILRSWKTDLPKGTCILIESSVNHPDAIPLLGGVRGVVLASRYLIEPCGSGKSRLTHVSRIDNRGRSPEWYNKIYGHLCCRHVTRLRDSLHHSTEGPESKV